MNLFLGNLVALIASILMVYAGVLKKKKKILYVQTIQIILSALSNIILGGITGAIINALSCIRNILCYYDKLNMLSKVLITISAVTLSLAFNNLGIIGLLPVISIVIYTLLMNVKDVIKFKILIIFSMVMWLIYDLAIKSYTASIFDFMTIVANIISIVSITSKRRT